MQNVGKMSKIWVICSNFMEFSANGQESESMELMWMNFVANFVGIVGKMHEICMIHCNFDQKSDFENENFARNF